MSKTTESPKTSKLDVSAIEKIVGSDFTVVPSKNPNASYCVVKFESDGKSRTVAYASGGASGADTLFKIPRDLSDFDSSLKVNAAGEALVPHGRVATTRKALKFASTAPVSKRKAVVK